MDYYIPEIQMRQVYIDILTKMCYFILENAEKGRFRLDFLSESARVVRGYTEMMRMVALEQYS